MTTSTTVTTLTTVLATMLHNVTLLGNCCTVLHCHWLPDSTGPTASRWVPGPSRTKHPAIDVAAVAVLLCGGQSPWRCHRCLQTQQQLPQIHQPWRWRSTAPSVTPRMLRWWKFLERRFNLAVNLLIWSWTPTRLASSASWVFIDHSFNQLSNFKLPLFTVSDVLSCTTCTAWMYVWSWSWNNLTLWTDFDQTLCSHRLSPALTGF